MAKKKSDDKEAQTRSQVMAIAERAVEQGATKAVVVVMYPDGSVSMSGTEDTNMHEVVYMLRQAEHFIFQVDDTDDDDD